ncbi:hypothetical protein J6590_006785 [Homalodisca vitripennis]|nr:hypothetical protein J6590_006785 [Homalodisca vitripennis]
MTMLRRHHEVELGSNKVDVLENLFVNVTNAVMHNIVVVAPTFRSPLWSCCAQIASQRRALARDPGLLTLSQRDVRYNMANIMRVFVLGYYILGQNIATRKMDSGTLVLFTDRLADLKH